MLYLRGNSRRKPLDGTVGGSHNGLTLQKPRIGTRSSQLRRYEEWAMRDLYCMAPVVYSLHNRQWRLFPQNTGTYLPLGCRKRAYCAYPPWIIQFYNKSTDQSLYQCFSKYAHTHPTPVSVHTLSSYSILHFLLGIPLRYFATITSEDETVSVMRQIHATNRTRKKTILFELVTPQYWSYMPGDDKLLTGYIEPL